MLLKLRESVGGNRKSAQGWAPIFTPDSMPCTSHALSDLYSKLQCQYYQPILQAWLSRSGGVKRLLHGPVTINGRAGAQTEA